MNIHCHTDLDRVNYRHKRYGYHKMVNHNGGGKKTKKSFLGRNGTASGEITNLEKSAMENNVPPPP